MSGGNGHSPRRAPAPGGYQPRVTRQPAPPPPPPAPSGISAPPAPAGLHLHLEQHMDWRLLLAGAACVALGMLAAALADRINRH